MPSEFDGPMPTLFHLPLSPFCRKVRVALAELGMPFVLEEERVWERREAFLALNPAGTVPALLLDNGHAISDSQTIAEYADETSGMPSLIGETPFDRAETRRLTAWFDGKFDREVSDHLYRERVLKRLAGRGSPETEAIRVGHINLEHHLAYIDSLLNRRHWLAGERFSLADITAGTQLSTLDYMGAVDWQAHQPAYEWYARFKSRPSMRPLLGDRVPGWRPAPHYTNLDF